MKGLTNETGGWGGIRTLETLARLPVFKTGAFNHSATHPCNAFKWLAPAALATNRELQPSCNRRCKITYSWREPPAASVQERCFWLMP
jgi:hypothetical protein